MSKDWKIVGDAPYERRLISPAWSFTFSSASRNATSAFSFWFLIVL